MDIHAIPDPSLKSLLKKLFAALGLEKISKSKSLSSATRGYRLPGDLPRCLPQVVPIVSEHLAGMAGEEAGKDVDGDTTATRAGEDGRKGRSTEERVEGNEGGMSGVRRRAGSEAEDEAGKRGEEGAGAAADESAAATGAAAARPAPVVIGPAFPDGQMTGGGREAGEEEEKEEEAPTKASEGGRERGAAAAAQASSSRARVGPAMPSAEQLRIAAQLTEAAEAVRYGTRGCGWDGMR